MIIIGGLTRLTESGLSMVDWKPIMGTFPPLSYSSWIEVFNKYKLSPEYKIVNSSFIWFFDVIILEQTVLIELLLIVWLLADVV